ncbi:MAG: hypothetical protein WA405_00640 [Candidatus Acidiferrales bacterium]
MAVTYRQLALLVPFLYLVWKYRKNKVIALGTITLGLVALTFLLSKVHGVPDWVLGVFVAIFLLLAIAIMILPFLYLVKWLAVKARRGRDGNVGAKAPTP